VLLEKWDTSPGSEGLQAKKTTGGDSCGSHSLIYTISWSGRAIGKKPFEIRMKPYRDKTQSHPPMRNPD
jgi:hypothetical protein